MCLVTIDDAGAVTIEGSHMITCVVHYTIDPEQIEAFARRWIELVDQYGGQHHGYFLPSEGASDKALALFTFPSLAAYEQYQEPFRGRTRVHLGRPLPRRQWVRRALRAHVHASGTSER